MVTPFCASVKDNNVFNLDSTKLGRSIHRGIPLEARQSCKSGAGHSALPAGLYILLIRPIAKNNSQNNPIIQVDMRNSMYLWLTVAWVWCRGFRLNIDASPTHFEPGGLWAQIPTYSCINDHFYELFLFNCASYKDKRGNPSKIYCQDRRAKRRTDYPSVESDRINRTAEKQTLEEMRQWKL